MSIRETIQAADDGTATPYDVPEWGVKLEIRSMTARSRARFVAELSSDDGTIAGLADPARIEEMWWHVISQTCFDPKTNELAFEDGDQEWLFEKNAKVVNDLANECMTASGLTEEAQGDAGKDSLVSLTGEDGGPLNADSTSG